MGAGVERGSGERGTGRERHSLTSGRCCQQRPKPATSSWDEFCAQRAGSLFERVCGEVGGELVRSGGLNGFGVQGLGFRVRFRV